MVVGPTLCRVAVLEIDQALCEIGSGCGNGNEEGEEKKRVEYSGWCHNLDIGGGRRRGGEGSLFYHGPLSFVGCGVLALRPVTLLRVWVFWNERSPSS